MGTPLTVGASLGDCEGIYLRALGDGQQYVVQLMQGTPLQTRPLPEEVLAVLHPANFGVDMISHFKITSSPCPGCSLALHLLLF